MSKYRRKLPIAWWIAAPVLGFAIGMSGSGVGAKTNDAIPNNKPIENPIGCAATFSTQGFVNLTGDYFQAQGTNGRSCASCHNSDDAWGITPGTLQRLFDETVGTHPVFNALDANNPAMDR